MNTQTETAIARITSPQNQHRRIAVNDVLQMCGGVSAMTLHRWLNNPDLNFPKPQYIGRRRYWKEAEVIAWLEAREAA